MARYVNSAPFCFCAYKYLKSMAFLSMSLVSSLLTVRGSLSYSASKLYGAFFKKLIFIFEGP